MYYGAGDEEVYFKLSSSLFLLIMPLKTPSLTTNTADARTISNSTYTCSIGVCSVTLKRFIKH